MRLVHAQQFGFSDEASRLVLIRSNIMLNIKQKLTNTVSVGFGKNTLQ